MPHLDVLTRASKRPVTDFHLCLLNLPKDRKEIDIFFNSTDISAISSEILNVETQLSQLERRLDLTAGIMPYDEYPFETISVAKQEQMDINLATWQDRQNAWLRLRRTYEKIKDQASLFQQENDANTEPVSGKGTSASSHLAQNRKGIEKTAIMSSGRDFLLSIAGMFSSNEDDISDSSEKVDTIVASAILKKYGHGENGSVD